MILERSDGNINLLMHPWRFKNPIYKYSIRERNDTKINCVFNKHINRSVKQW